MDKKITINLDQIRLSIINQRNLFFKSVLLTFFLSVLIFFLIPKMYTSSFTLLPDNNSAPTGLSSAIGLIGMDVGDFRNNEESFTNPDIVEELFKSRSFAKKLLTKSSVIDSNGNTENILNFLVPNSDFEKTFDSHSKTIVKEFAQIRQDIETGIYFISITTENPYASYNICNITLDTLTEYRSEIFLSLNKQKRDFLEKKIRIAAEEVDLAEKDILEFISQNTNYLASPTLSLIHSSKKNNLDLLSKLYWKYKQDLEILDLEEISMVGGLVIVDKPYIDFIPSFPTKTTLLTIFILLFLFVNVPYVLYRDYQNQQ